MYIYSVHIMSSPVYIGEVRVSGPAVVYVMRDWGKVGQYKIGCSSNLTRRYGSNKSLQKIVLVIVVPEEMNLYEAERMVHDAFNKKRAVGYGEIFLLDELDIKRLSNMFFLMGKLRERYGD